MTCENIDIPWFDNAPRELRKKAEELLDAIQSLRDSGVVIYPKQQLIFNALATTAPLDVSVVIVGQDPYHEPGQAMGLSFSVPAGVKLPPSLRNIYKELAADMGCSVPTSGDLTSWANQGVLLLNTTLTVEEHKANSHVKLGWDAITNYVVQTCMSLPQPIVFLAWGRNAIDLIAGARDAVGQAGPSSIANKYVLASTHPSPLSASRGTKDVPAFLGSRPFSQANVLLEEAGARPINWESVVDAQPQQTSLF